MSHEEKFEAIRRRYLAAAERRSQAADSVRLRYGPSGYVYATKAERERRDRADAAMSRESDKMFALLDKVSPRRWRSGVAAWWVMERLSWEDAITTGPLSTLPQPGYGTTVKEIERFAEAVPVKA